MKAKTPIRPAAQPIGGVVSRDANGNSPNASAIVGVTLLGDFEDVLAVLRTAILLAKTLKAPLSLNLIGKDILSGHVDETPNSTLVSDLLDSVGTQLRGLNVAAFAMEVNVIAASFVCAGSVTMSVHRANPILRTQHT